jgi:alkylation response protein AidB-like acyl-CoA dehydrogenase
MRAEGGDRMDPITGPEPAGPGAAPAHPLIARVRGLVPLLDSAGPRIEAARELPPDVLDALFDADLFRALLPRALGGAELAPRVFVELTETIARGDASAAWCLCQGAVSAMSVATYLEPAVVAELFDGPRAVLAWGARHDRARAVAVEGGHRITGQWGFASGSRHARLLGAHIPIAQPDGTVRDRTFVFPRASARIVDDWQVIGLRGTGSDSYAVEDLFVPLSRSCVRDDATARTQPGPLYRLNSHLMYAAGFAGVALGIARGLLDRLLVLARDRRPRGLPMPMGENPAVQGHLARLVARWRAARAYLHGTVEGVWAELVQGCEPSLDRRMALRLAATHVINEATEVSVAAYRAAGTGAVLESQPFERRFRDACAASQHLQGRPEHYEMVGRHLLGREQETQFV